MNKSKTLIYIDSLLLSYEIKQESIGANIDIIDVIGITEVNNVIYLALEVEYNDYCYLTHVKLINMWACPNDDDKQEIKEELLSNLFEDVTIQSSNINVGDIVRYIDDIYIKDIEENYFFLSDDETPKINVNYVVSDLHYDGIDEQENLIILYQLEKDGEPLGVLTNNFEIEKVSE